MQCRSGCISETNQSCVIQTLFESLSQSSLSRKRARSVSEKPEEKKDEEKTDEKDELCLQGHKATYFTTIEEGIRS